MSRTPNVQKEIEGHIARINYLYDSDTYKTKKIVAQIQPPYNQQWFDSLTTNYSGELPLISYMKQNETKPLELEKAPCIKEIFIWFMDRNLPLDEPLANRILNTIFN